jgi:hypothetical protein
MVNINTQGKGFADILSIDADAKTIKGHKFGYQTAICYLAPATIASKRTVCPFATQECTRACLYSAGHGGLNSVQQARIARTLYWQNSPERFLAQLRDELFAAEKRAKKRGLRFVIRLNGTSDIQWEKTGIMDEFAHLQYYDYTKFSPMMRRDIPANYHLTYSFTGIDQSADWSAGWNSRGFNTAVVFRGGLPAQFLGRPVLNGDESDLRFLDPAGHIVGLKAKGKAINDLSSRFIVNV